MSQNLNVSYHGCGACYFDGTLPLISKQDSCSSPTEHPFWKDPWDVTDGINSRNHLKRGKFAPPSYIDAYFDYKIMQTRFHDSDENKSD